MKIILASASPRRAQLLSHAGFSFQVCAVAVDESRLPGESAAAMALRLAEAKARAVVAQQAAQAAQGTVRMKAQSAQQATIEETTFIGADTIVELDGDALGKPGSPGAARAMLRRLSGRSHRVITGIAMVCMPDGRSKCETEATQVRFATIDAEEIAWYVAAGEPVDKAGAYAIQGLGGRFIEQIEGCYFNVVGLPLGRVYRMLKELGWRQYP